MEKAKTTLMVKVAGSVRPKMFLSGLHFAVAGGPVLFLVISMIGTDSLYKSKKIGKNTHSFILSLNMKIFYCLNSN